MVDKDLFIEVFRSYLAKRLLNEKSQSIELEKNMISFIKMQSGPQFTKKLEGMLNDLSMAHDQSKAYEQHLATTPSGGLNQSVDFSITILTSSHWPTYKNFPDLYIPRELVPSMESFKQWYQAKHHHRQVRWCYSLGSAVVSAKFEKKTFDCVVGTLQMAIIMLIGSHGGSEHQLSVKDIKDTLKIDDDTLYKNIKSLMMK